MDPRLIPSLLLRMFIPMAAIYLLAMKVLNRAQDGIVATAVALREADASQQNALFDIWNEPFHGGSCSSAYQKTSISLSTDICLTGLDFRRNDIRIRRNASCPDGSAPIFSRYLEAGCSDRFVDDSTVTQAHPCLHIDTAESYRWSLIFKCSKESGTLINAQNKASLADSILPKRTKYAFFRQADFSIPGTARSFKSDICHTLEERDPIVILPPRCDNTEAPILHTWPRRNCTGDSVSHGSLEYATPWDLKQKQTFSLYLQCGPRSKDFPMTIRQITVITTGLVIVFMLAGAQFGPHLELSAVISMTVLCLAKAWFFHMIPEMLLYAAALWCGISLQWNVVDLQRRRSTHTQRQQHNH